ncbi:hypothetical protein [Rhodococcoides yunnanense]|uniref:Uncharacterized protein n=1 Tax=Rhodococcoides yunnanense TaxID=278209 RepID=A0ABU4B6D0_9NOCA|nr:hypothetical protein [Rhodococcus yunnanensis]MDV6259746.1 hypothetical protein [Rhodococcus yunnanensis]
MADGLNGKNYTQLVTLGIVAGILAGIVVGVFIDDIGRGIGFGLMFGILGATVYAVRRGRSGGSE